MRGSVLTYPLGYLSLEDEDGNKLFRRNALAVIVVVAVISFPFIFLNANYFGDKGFLDRFGSFSAILTGFYIAALVGIASFTSSVGDLDKEIEVGKIRRPLLEFEEDEDPWEFLTRRQYVCFMFGYLSFVSLILSVVSIMLIIGSDPVRHATVGVFIWIGIDQSVLIFFRAAVIILFNLVLAHLLVTTCHGLYYLIDRLYAKKPVPLPKRDRRSAAMK